MKALTLLLLVVLSSLLVSAQKNYPLSPEFRWRTMSMKPNALDGDPFMEQNVQQGYVYDKDAVIVPVMRFDDKEGGLVKINSAGKLMWEIEGKGGLALGRFKDKVISFYGGRPGKRNKAKIMAVLVDPEKGKVLLEQDLGTHLHWYTGKSINDQLQNSHGFAVSYSEYSRTIDLDIFQFNEKLEQNKIHFDFDKSITYLGITANNLGELFLAALTDGALVIKKIDSKGDAIQTMSYPLSYKKGDGQSINFYASTQDPQKLIIGLQYQDKEARNTSHLTAVMNFSTKTVSATRDFLDRPFEKMLKDKLSGGENSLRFIEYLKFGGLIQSGDKLISIREINYYTSVQFKDAIVVTVYDKDLKNSVYHVVPKVTLQAYLFTPSTGYHLKGNDLYLPYFTQYKVNSYNTHCVILDISNGKQTELEFKDVEKPAYLSLEAGATFWFPDHCIFHLLDAKGAMNDRYLTYFERMDYAR